MYVLIMEHNDSANLCNTPRSRGTGEQEAEAAEEEEEGEEDHRNAMHLTGKTPPRATWPDEA